MAFSWSRCTASIAAACLAALGLSACGSGDVVSALQPARIVSFGDGHSDIGQSGTRYTVNGASDHLNWTEQLAHEYGLRLQPAAQAGLSYAQGNARIQAKADGAGQASAATLAEQIDQFLGNQAIGERDLLLVSGGTSDLIALARAALDGRITRVQAIAQAAEAGQALSAQVQRLIAKGAQHVAVIGTYNLGESLWANHLREKAFLTELSRKFNESFKIAMDKEGFGNSALYLDFEYFINNIVNGPQYFGIEHMDRPVCTSIDAGAGIGIGAGQINSGLCNLSTVASDRIDRYGFADWVYFTPTVQRQFGIWATGRIRDRW
ncbi:GDSL family lipase [Allofranklinella schreckenbergeri]|uniref:GDSL family lipase n=1 Tax=Allofranklinella schreckenbergeri TaxID=1076744 RepID=A0A3M6QEY5_9BURK|nr:SGNH/GDSL hydrolase family protein [Allofranklinella schreckenbergeri]RMX01445.1 GDSL family lipase [Allofranklinella schreckenbergeri]